MVALVAHSVFRLQGRFFERFQFSAHSRSPLWRMHPGNLYLLDGGLATSVESGFNYAFKSKLWSSECLLEHPDYLETVHRQFLGEREREGGTECAK